MAWGGWFICQILAMPCMICMYVIYNVVGNSWNSLEMLFDRTRMYVYDGCAILNLFFSYILYTYLHSKVYVYMCGVYNGKMG